MNSATTQKLMRMVPKCPACDSKLIGHQFAELATTVCERENLDRLTRFIEHARTQQWVELREFKEFKGDNDDLVAHVIACGERGVLVVIKSVFELYAADELVMLDTITQNHMGVLRALIDADCWHPIND